jgi:hypothetical protein
MTVDLVRDITSRKGRNIRMQNVPVEDTTGEARDE